jgi:hypothetical protein
LTLWLSMIAAEGPFAICHHERVVYPFQSAGRRASPSRTAQRCNSVIRPSVVAEGAVPIGDLARIQTASQTFVSYP